MTPTRIVLNVHGGVVQDVFCSDVNAEVRLVDWDVEESGLGASGIVEVAAGGERTQLAFVGELRAGPLTDLAETDFGRAIRAAEVHDGQA